MSKCVSSRVKGILCTISAAFCFALMGLFVRLSGDIPFIQKSFFRNFVALLVVLIPLYKERKEIEIKKGDWKYLVLRAVFGSVGIFANFYALDHLVLSDASMLNKLSPFFAVLFSYFILKEKFTFAQGAAVFTAFIGALFIIKPSGNMGNFAALIGAIGGVGAGAAYTMVRVLGKRKVNSNFIIMFFSAFSCLISLPFMIHDYTPMNMAQLGLLICAGIAAAGGQFSITRAYFYAPAKEISVYDYSQIIFSALLGFVFLKQIPDGYSVIGYVIISTTAVLIYIYNMKKSPLKE